MRFDSVRSKIIVGILFIFMVSSSASAGTLTIRNLHGTKSYYVAYDSWILGIKNQYGLCADPGKTNSVNSWFSSIGVLTVYEQWGACSTKKYSTRILKQYTPSGAYLPHRAFTTIIESTGNINISDD